MYADSVPRNIPQPNNIIFIGPAFYAKDRHFINNLVAVEHSADIADAEYHLNALGTNVLGSIQQLQALIANTMQIETANM